MKVKYLMPVEKVSGAMSPGKGVVSFTWRNLGVLRSYRIPRNPQTVDQVAIRNILTQCAQGFQTITPTQKLNWASYASDKPNTWEGTEYTIPEISAYVKSNSYRLINGVALSNDAPTAYADFVASDIANVAYVTGTTVLSFDVTHNATVTTNKQWVIKITGTLPSQVYSVRKGDYRLAKGVDTASIIPVTASPQTVSITAPKYGNWANGEFMAIELTPLSPDYDAGATYFEINAITVT